jgi:hypothetical protein
MHGALSVDVEVMDFIAQNYDASGGFLLVLALSQ